MGNVESGVAFSEDFIGQVNSMAALMAEEGSIPLTSLKPLVEVLKDIGQSIRHVEEMCSRLEKEVVGLRNQQFVTDTRVAEQGVALQAAFKTYSPHAPAENPASNTEESEKSRPGEKQKTHEREKENTQTVTQNEKKRRDKKRAQSPVHATTKDETANSLTTQLEEEAEEMRKFVMPKSVSGQNLFNAAAAGQIAELKDLLDAGVDPNVTAPAGTALHRAATKGNLSCISLLLERGAYPNVTDILGRTPLHLASLHGQIESIKELIKYGASVSAGEGNGQRPLHYAAIGGFGEAIKEILKQGEEVDVIDNCGETPLSLAVTFNRPGSTKALLEAGAKTIDINGKPLVTFASSEEVKQLLMSYK